MATITINAATWNVLSAEEKVQITDHLVKHKVLIPGDVITGGAAAGFPGDVFGDLGKALCQGACAAAAGAAYAALTLEGPALLAAQAAIAAAHGACNNAC